MTKRHAGWVLGAILALVPVVQADTRIGYRSDREGTFDIIKTDEDGSFAPWSHGGGDMITSNKKRRRMGEMSVAAAAVSIAAGFGPCLGEPAAGTAGPTAGSGTAIQMNRVALLPWSLDSLTTAHGFDVDQDGQGEFVLHLVGEGTPAQSVWSGAFEFYECSGDDSFLPVHLLDLTVGTTVSAHPGDIGDGDRDGLPDLTVYGRKGNDLYLRVYEAESSGSYPTKLTWEIGGGAFEGWGWAHGMKIADLDGDEWPDLVAGGEFFDLQPRVVVFENNGDDSYQLTFNDVAPGGMVDQSFTVANDLDDDGKPEFLLGGIGGLHSVVAYESAGDDSYEMVWSLDFNPTINTSFPLHADDLDGDGRKVLLAGGMKPGSPLQCHLHIVEAVGNDDVHVVATLIRPASVDGDCRANVADVDGDGHQEIVFGWGSDSISIYQNAGDNAWTEIWSTTGAFHAVSIGVGDHDQDGKDEIMFRVGSSTSGFTSVWEIDPAYEADVDGDGKVDAIDNCAAAPNPGQEDLDGDEVGDLCDNCEDAPNPAQGPAVLGQTILAPSHDAFAWQTPVDVDYVRGDLSLVNDNAVDLLDSLSDATSFMDVTTPVSSAGFWYLVKPSCFVGSWQSELGAEPARDVELP